MEEGRRSRRKQGDMAGKREETQKETGGMKEEVEKETRRQEE